MRFDPCPVEHDTRKYHAELDEVSELRECRSCGNLKRELQWVFEYINGVWTNREVCANCAEEE
jgi:hypothetical protein